MAPINILCILVVLLSVISGGYSTPCKTHKDIFFLLDESGSIYSNDWVTMKEFIIKIIENVTMGTEMTHFGVMPFHERYNNETTIKLTDFYDKQPLIKKINSITQKGGGTDIARAFSAVCEYMGSDYGGRHVEKIVILITDGWSDTKTAIEEAENCKGDGITIYAIGIGPSTDENLLKGVSSHPQTNTVNYWKMTHTNTLFNVRFKLADSICDLKESKCIPNCLECPEDNLSVCKPKKCAMGFAEANNHTACLSCAKHCLKCVDAGPGKCDEGYCHKDYPYLHSDKTCKTPDCSAKNCLDCGQGDSVCHKCKDGFTYDQYGKHQLRADPGCYPCAENCRKCDNNFVGKCDSDGCEDGYEYDSFTATCKEIPCQTITNCLKCVNNLVCDECRPPLKRTQHGQCEIDRSSCEMTDISESTLQDEEYDSIDISSLSRSSGNKKGVDCTNAPNCSLVSNLNIFECREDSSTYLFALEVYLENVANFYAQLDNSTLLDQRIIDTNSRTVNTTFTKQLPGNILEMQVQFRSHGRTGPKYKIRAEICCEQKCDKGCENCTLGSCNKCRKGYVLKDDQCHACGKNCVECDKNAPSKCLECTIGHVLDTNYKVCKPCAPHCYSCSAAQRCDRKQCRVGYALADDRSCKPCAVHCFGCTEHGPGTCDLNKCHKGFYYDTEDKVCREMKCDNETLVHCLNCEENSKVCRVCENPYIVNHLTGECYLTSALCTKKKMAQHSMNCLTKWDCVYEASFDCGDHVPFMMDVYFFQDIAPYKPPFSAWLDGQSLDQTDVEQSNVTISGRSNYRTIYPVNTRGSNIRVQFNNTGDKHIQAGVLGVGCCIETIGYKDCKITTAGKEYIGTVHKTAKGRQCQHWNATEPHAHGMRTSNGVQFPDGTDFDAKNYCRNPTDNRPDGPWCYIDIKGSDPTWDYCDIKFCDDKKPQKPT